VGWRKTREREQEGTRRARIRGGLCLGIVSVEEEHVSVGDELPTRKSRRQRGGPHKEVKKGERTASIPCFARRPTSTLNTH
jgi:hypothetical protein